MNIPAIYRIVIQNNLQVQITDDPNNRLQCFLTGKLSELKLAARIINTKGYVARLSLDKKTLNVRI